MYWTPCARLMRSITPNTSVSPAAIRNSSTPSCSPLRICTKSKEDIRISHHDPVAVIARPRAHRWWARPLRLRCAALAHPTSFHRTVFRVGVLVIREHLLGDLGLELAVLALGRLDQIEVLDRIVIIAELEIAPQRFEVGLLERGTQRILVG